MADRKRPKQKLDIPAEEWNTSLDVNAAFKATQFRNASQRGEQRERSGADVVYVKNSTNADITNEKAVLGIGAALIKYEDSAKEFNYNASVSGVTPSGSHADKFVILWSPVKANGMTKATLSGLVTCKVKINEITDEYCAAGSGDIEKLHSSATSSSGYILWRPRPDEKGIQDCLVRISNPGGGGLSEVPYGFEYDYFYNGQGYGGGYGYQYPKDDVPLSGVVIRESEMRCGQPGCIEFWTRLVRITLDDHQLSRDGSDWYLQTVCCSPNYGYSDTYGWGYGDPAYQEEGYVEKLYPPDPPPLDTEPDVCLDVYTNAEAQAEDFALGGTTLHGDLIVDRQTAAEGEDITFLWTVTNEGAADVNVYYAWWSPAPGTNAFDITSQSPNGGTYHTIEPGDSKSFTVTLNWSGDDLGVAAEGELSTIKFQLDVDDTIVASAISRWYMCDQTTPPISIGTPYIVDGPGIEVCITGDDYAGTHRTSVVTVCNSEGTPITTVGEFNPQDLDWDMWSSDTVCIVFPIPEVIDLSEISIKVVTDGTTVTWSCDGNVAPVTSGIEGANLEYAADDPATQITNSISITDADDTHLQSGSVQITTGYEPGEDVLSYVQVGNIVGTLVSNGHLTLAGNDTLANWIAALKAVKYANTESSPVESTRTVTFTVNDLCNDSNTQTRNIEVVASGTGCTTIGGHNDVPNTLDATFGITSPGTGQLIFNGTETWSGVVTAYGGQWVIKLRYNSGSAKWEVQLHCGSWEELLGSDITSPPFITATLFPTSGASDTCEGETSPYTSYSNAVVIEAPDGWTC